MRSPILMVMKHNHECGEKHQDNTEECKAFLHNQTLRVKTMLIRYYLIRVKSAAKC